MELGSGKESPFSLLKITNSIVSPSQSQESVIKVDCIIRKGSPYRRAEFDRRQRITIEDFSTWITSKEDLIISKLWWAKDSHSELQLRDVKNLASTGCDTGYVKRWTKELGLHNLWLECQT